MDFKKLLPLIQPHEKDLYWAFSLVAGSWLLLLLVTAVIYFVGPKVIKPVPTIPKSSTAEFKPFADEDTFREYLTNQTGNSGAGFISPMMARQAVDVTNSAVAETSLSKTPASNDRYSTTNVQIAGIDEPDIVKTNGSQIFVAGENRYYFRDPMPLTMEKRLIEPGIMPPIETYSPQTQIITALPPKAAKVAAKIDGQGSMLLFKDILVIFGNDGLITYDVKDESKPVKIWDQKYGDNRQFVDARTIDGKLLLITQAHLYPDIPCRIEVFRNNPDSVISCTQIYHPTFATGETSYTVNMINPENGGIEKTLSFMANYGQATIGVFKNNLYLAYEQPFNYQTAMSEYLTDPNNSLLPTEIKVKLRAVVALDISSEAKNVEYESIINKYALTLNKDNRTTFYTKRENGFQEFIKQNSAKYDQTHLVRVELKNLSVAASQSISGHLLNQFSLDEYNDILRLAVTTGGRNFGGNTTSSNQLVTFDLNLTKLGSVEGLGETERIYAVRFIDSKAYIVTFKETDPLYSFDLSDPVHPQKTGELKIPGYSSYLHPLANNLLIGIGKEDTKVKVSLFDVSANEPAEISTYILDSYWSEIANSHHAFLNDPDKEIVVIPADNKAVILSYNNHKLTLEKAFAGNFIRSLYINNALYLIKRDGLTAVSLSDFSTLKELSF